MTSTRIAGTRLASALDPKPHLWTGARGEILNHTLWAYIKCVAL